MSEPRMARRLDLNLLVAFEAIYAARNITAAGRSLGLSQPAASHALARLRAAFGDPLFVRTTGGLQPTPLAAEIAPELRQSLALVRRTLERKSFDPATATRVFRIRIGDVAEVLHLPPLVQRLTEIAPRVRVDSVAIPEHEIGDALAAGAIDIAVGNYRLGSGCRETPLYEGEYACIVREGHPSIGTRLGPAQFRAAGHIHVVPKGVSPHAQVVRRALARANARVVVQVSNFYAVMAMVASTDLVATIPFPLAESMRRAARIRVLRPPIPLPGFTVSVYWHERFHRESANVWLRERYLELIDRPLNGDRGARSRSRGTRGPACS